VAGGIAGAILGGGVAFVTVKATDDDQVVATTPAPLAQSNSVPVNPASPATTAAGSGSTAPTPSVGQGTFDIQAVLAAVSPSVVSIETGVQGSSGLFPNGAGSGVIISADGLVLTNNHVIEGADAIQVRTDEGEQFDADLVGREPSRDIALIQLRNASGLTPATLGDTDTLLVGDTVVAIGNALNLGETPSVTVGIVSAKNREITTETETLRDLIQTDAAINPGNSGGALVNTAGQLVGINTAGIPDAQNISFAIDINGVKPLMERLKTAGGGVVEAPFLGVGTVPVRQLTADERTNLGIEAERGLAVTSVSAGSGAEAAGVEVGDVIVAVDGNELETTGDLRNALDAKGPSDTVDVSVQRGNEQVTLTATLSTRPR
jgi:S1-C subfamily serine protease